MDSWYFSGEIMDIYKQIGNAVPVGLGFMAGKNVVQFHEEKNNLIAYSRYKNTTGYEFNEIFLSQLGKKEKVKKEATKK